MDRVSGQAQCEGKRVEPMQEILRTNDVVKLSWVQALLSDSGIESVVLDTHMSIVEGSLGILPRRLMVSRDDFERACRVLAAAGEEGRS